MRHTFMQSFPYGARKIETEVTVGKSIFPGSDGEDDGALVVPGVRGIWDTGATCSAISRDLALKLCLIKQGQSGVMHFDGLSWRPQYRINVFLPNKVVILDVLVTEFEHAGLAMLVGMDVIARGVFTVATTPGKTLLTFTITTSDHIGMPEHAVYDLDRGAG